MKRTETKRILTANEFKTLNQCMQCRHMENIEKNSICNNCQEMKRTECKFCECILKNDIEKINTYYIYVDNENDKEKVKRHYQSKRLIKEFLVESEIYSKKHSNDLCENCFHYVEYLKHNFKEMNYCVRCDNRLVQELTFENLFEQIKINGRYCKKCNNI